MLNYSVEGLPGAVRGRTNPLGGWQASRADATTGSAASAPGALDGGYVRCGGISQVATAIPGGRRVSRVATGYIANRQRGLL